MKSIPVRKKKVAAPVRRKPFDKVEEQTKIKIVEEIKYISEFSSQNTPW